MTGSAWDEYSDPGFADVADNIRAALDSDHQADLKAKRRAGLRAYEKAMETRGTAPGRRAIMNALNLTDDDLED